MNPMTYQDQLKRHLAHYKTHVLGIAEPGVFRYRGRNVPYEHILPRALADQNMTSRARPLLAAHERSKPHLHRHRYFHHLNSSQAFAFNLFLPYFDGGEVASAALLRALGQSSPLAVWEMEAVPVPEEGTNIDVFWSTTDGVSTFCEVKLSEAEFGRAVHDDRHLEKLSHFYEPVLTGHVDSDLLKPGNFFAAYQIMRNVWHMVREERSRLMFLLPKANVRLWTILEDALSKVGKPTRSRIAAVAIEDVIHRLARDSSCPTELRGYAQELERKYVCG